MNAMPRPANLLLFATFASVMVATRFHHFGTAINLPDASMALFFLGGLFLRKHWQFAAYLAMALVIDWVAIEVVGTDDFCVTPAYSFLLPAYAVLWYGGRCYADRLQESVGSLAEAAGVGLLASVVSFAISNGAFYWLGGRHTAPLDLTGHWQSFAQWMPLFVRTTMTYIVVALALYAVAARVLRRDGQRPASV